MGKHFTFGDGDGDNVEIKSEGDGNFEKSRFKIDRGGGRNGQGGRGGGDDGNSRGRGFGDRYRGSRGGGNFRGRGGGNFRGGGRGMGNFRGRGRGGRFSKNFRDGDGSEVEKPKLGVLSDEMMAYYRQVSATVEAGFDDDDPDVKKNFLDNVFTAVKDEGVKVSQNQTVSHIVEGLLAHSHPSHLRILFVEFCNHLTTVSFDRFASHVFQSLIQYLPDMYDDEDLGEEKNSFKEVVDKLCEFTLSEIKQFLTDTYGSHVLRSLLEVLGGVEVNQEVIRSHSSRNKRKDFDSKKNLQLRKKIRFSKELSSDFQSAFDAVKSEVVSILSDEATDHLTDPNFCLVLQTTLLILHQANTSEYQQIASMLMDKARPLLPVKTEEGVEDDATGPSLPALVQDSVGSYLIELLVSLSSELEIPQLYKKVFRGNLSSYALHPVANYVLQKLCAGLATNPKYLKEVVREITPHMEDILACNHIGVITKVAEACRGHPALQKTLTQAVMQAFHCDDTEEKRKKITPLIASMTVYEVFFPSEIPEVKEEEGEKEKDEGAPKKCSPRLLKTVTIHGSLLLQQLVQFDNPKYVVAGLLGLTPAELSNLASDQCGSHVVEAFFNSPSVWDRQKDEFVRKIKGLYINIACNKNGSRCLEGIWKGCAIKNKIFIAEELLKSRQRLESDRFGKFLWYNFNMVKFATRQKDWINHQSGIDKKQKILQDILEGGSNKKNRPQKRPAVEQSQEDRIDSSDIVKIEAPDGKKRKTDDKNEESTSRKEKKKHKKNKKGKT